MTTTRKCPQCGAEMAETAEGLCPACLLKRGMASEAATKTGTGGSSGNVPDVQEVAKRFPQLEIIELLGAGGMGVVYKARQPQLDRLVALKVLPPGAVPDQTFADRFIREARAMARLNHPNIVTVYEYGETDGFYYLIMEFVDGANLRQIEQSRRLSPAEALTIIPRICDALQYAHEEGIVHRDIKPENILVDRKGRVKITDFGLAKLLGHLPSDLRPTNSRLVMGTPHYMAPEQVEHPSQVDHRADIYALGVVFYEMLTGELPMGRFALPSQKVQVDVRLDEVVLHALEKDPARRYQHASEVKTDVENIAQAKPVQRGRRMFVVMAATSVVGLLAAGLFVWAPWKETGAKRTKETAQLKSAIPPVAVEPKTQPAMKTALAEPVEKRTENVSIPALSAKPSWAVEPVTEGVGWGELKLGMSEQDMFKLLGSPDGRDAEYDKWRHSGGTFKASTYKALPGVTLITSPVRGLFQINFYEASKAILKSGVGIGTPINEVLKQYEGQRTDTTTESGITCKPKGVGITCSKTNENKVSRFMIFMPSGKPPQSASAPATSTPPSNQVTGVTRTLAPTRPIPAAPLSARPKWASEPVIEGVGWGEAKLGMTEEELSKLLGSPDGKDKRYDTVSGVTKRPDGLVTHVYSPGSYKGYTYQTLPGVTFVIAPSRDLWRIDFQEESKAILQSGVRIGSPMDEVSQKYGHPSRTREVPYVGVLTDDDELAVSPTEYGIQRRTKGITFRFSKANENKLSGFFIHKSQPGTSRPTTAAAPVVAKPTLPTPITNIVSEAAGASGTTELFYDFSDPKQLEDFVVDDGQGRWEVKDGALVGVGRRVFGIRLRRRFEGAISVSWEQSLHRPAELGEPTDRDEVNGGLRLGELETDFMNCYQAKALFVRGTSVLGRQNERDHACELKAIYHIPPGRRFGIANIANPSTFVQGQPILLDQVQRFQIATEYRPSGTHVCFQGLGWRIENDKHSEIKPHFVKLSACDCMVKYRNLRVRFSKADAASLAAAATATPMPAPPSASATTAPPPAATTPPASVPSPVSATRLPMSGARTAAQLVNDYRNGLVFFEGKDGKGSGFITDYKGQKFLLSNAHVLAGIKGAIFKLLDRAPIKIGTGSVAVGHDIIALGVIAGGTAIPMIEAVDKEVLIGDPVVVLGNAEGAGVITPLEGRIIGIGPDRIEVDAPFVPGNSGSPIIHLPTGKVVGIATYMLVKKIGAREEKVRRFGWRLDSVAQWQTIDWNRFYTEADAMNGIERTTRDLINLLASLNACRNATRITLSGKAKLSDAKAFLIQMAFQEIKCETPAIQKALVVFKESSGGLQDIKDLQTTLNKVSVNELRSAETQITYDYFKQQLANEKRDHDEITNLLRKELEVY